MNTEAVFTRNRQGRTVEAERIQRSALKSETPREALGHFLRERREALAPEEVGMSSHRGRRTPGLRREEVAFLADIGVKWYARLEAGDDVHPSAATLMGIASALRLSSAELEYMLELAGLHQPCAVSAEPITAVSEPLMGIVNGLQGVAATLSDRILTPIFWNRIADELYGHSRYKEPAERNWLVRSVFDPETIALLGERHEAFVMRAVGMFRLNYSSASPSPFVEVVFDKVKDHPLFRAAWNRRVIAADLTSRSIVLRNHRLVGRLEMYAADFSPPMRRDLLLLVHVPANEETVAKFARLEEAGRREPPASNGITALRSVHL